jgi:hypothetical protein
MSTRGPAKSLRFSFTAIPSQQVIPATVSMRWKQGTRMGISLNGVEVIEFDFERVNPYSTSLGRQGTQVSRMGTQAGTYRPLHIFRLAGGGAVKQANAAWEGTGLMFVKRSPAGHLMPVPFGTQFPWKDGALRLEVTQFVTAAFVWGGDFPFDASSGAPVYDGAAQAFTAQNPRPTVQFTYSSSGEPKLLTTWLEDVERITGITPLFVDAVTLQSIIDTANAFDDYYRRGDAKRDKLEQAVQLYGRRERLDVREVYEDAVESIRDLAGPRVRLRAQAYWFPDSGSRMVLLTGQFLQEDGSPFPPGSMYSKPYSELLDIYELRRRLGMNTVTPFFRPFFIEVADKGFEAIEKGPLATRTQDFPLVVKVIVLRNGEPRESEAVVTRVQKPRSIVFRIVPQHRQFFFGPTELTLAELQQEPVRIPASQGFPAAQLAPGEAAHILITNDARLSRGLRG